MPKIKDDSPYKNYIKQPSPTQEMKDFDLTGQTDIGTVPKPEKIRKSVEESKSLQLFLKHKTLSFIIILIIATVFPRLYFASLPIADFWAENIVKEDIQNWINQEVETQYETLSKYKKTELKEQLLQRELKKPEVKQQIQALSNQLKDNFKDPSGQVYLYESDPYFYYSIIKTETFPKQHLGMSYLGRVGCVSV